MRTLGGLAFILGIALPGQAVAAEVPALVTQIKAVRNEGAGNEAAGRAWRELVQAGPSALLPVIAGMDGADASATNWLRMAVDALVERAAVDKKPLPARDLESFVLQVGHAPAARRAAYECLVRADPTAPKRLLPNLLQDTSMEIRREAVAFAIEAAAAKGADKASAITAYRKALEGARDRDQVDAIAKQLKTLGVEVDLAAHFGFLRDWMLVGPFDSTGGKGHATVYPPEKAVDLSARYDGKAGQPVVWTAHSTSHPYGMVDLNKALKKHMGAAAYAFAVVESRAERPIEIRAGSYNALKIFLNGKQLFGREEYHHGLRMDQHVAFGSLRAGKNEVLVKICQNEQTESWAQSWSFQLRICDATGTAVPVTIVNAKGEQRR